MQSWHKRPRSCAIGFEQQEPWATRAPLSGVQCHSEVQGGGGGQWVQASFNKHRHTLALLHHTCPFTHIKQDYRYYMRHYSGQWRHDGTLGVLLSLAYRSFNLNSFLLSHSLSLAVHLISLSLYIYLLLSLWLSLSTWIYLSSPLGLRPSQYTDTEHLIVQGSAETMFLLRACSSSHLACLGPAVLTNAILVLSPEKAAPLWDTLSPRCLVPGQAPVTAGFTFKRATEWPKAWRGPARSLLYI